MRTSSSSWRRIGTASDGVERQLGAREPWTCEMQVGRRPSRGARPCAIAGEAVSPPRSSPPPDRRATQPTSAQPSPSRLGRMRRHARSAPRPSRARRNARRCPGNSAGGSRPSQRQVEQADVIHPRPPLLALASDQRMLEQRQQRDRRQVLRRRRSDRQKQSARRKFRQRPARAVVGLDTPAARAAPTRAAPATGRE